MKKRIHLHFSFLILVCCLFSINAAFATKFTVNNQADWNTISLPLLPGDSICITDLAVGPNAIVSTTGMASIQGTIVNAGDFTMNNAGVSIIMSGKILNLGTFTVGNVGLSVEGLFENAGTLNISGAAVVIQSSGSFLNAGTINNNVDLTILGGGSFLSCNSVTGSGSFNGIIAGNPPVGTACDDEDEGTINDRIIDTSCTCEGEPIPVAAEDLPSMGQWGLIMLGMITLVFSLFLLRKKSLV